MNIALIAEELSRSGDISDLRMFFQSGEIEALAHKRKFRYLQKGEEEEIDKKFLTANRIPWYSLENRPPAPIWVSVFNRTGLRFIRNEANISNLTSYHCI